MALLWLVPFVLCRALGVRLRKLASSGTLVCCALPALFVTVGAGAALSSLVSAVPQLVWLSENKEPLFVCRTAQLLPAGAAMGV